MFHITVSSESNDLTFPFPSITTTEVAKCNDSYKEWGMFISYSIYAFDLKLLLLLLLPKPLMFVLRYYVSVLSPSLPPTPVKTKKQAATRRAREEPQKKGFKVWELCVMKVS